MSDKTKKIFFALTIVVPILLYCAYYYGMMIKNAPYRFSDFKYMRFEYGTGDTLKNKYDSRTGAYQYVTRSGAIKNMELHLTKDDLLYLHRKAADLGFWNFPEKEEGDGFTGGKDKAPKYLMEFVYKGKTKKVLFDASFAGDPNLKDANQRLIKEIQMKLDEREEQLKK